MTSSQKESYNEMPYTCKAFHFLYPGYLKSISTIFGLESPDIKNARILELGCGSGEGFFGFLGNYPSLEYIGVDISEAHIEHGKKVAKECALDNVELYAMSIEDIDKKKFGTFDYIICHGVFSWVPKNIQDKILEIMGKMLTPKGLAFVSYNSLPGWNMVNPIRDMLQYHTDLFTNKNDKVQQARTFIQFLSETSKEAGSPYSGFIENESNTIAANDDSFLYHEYLVEGNTEFYFTDFVQQANKKGLQYLSESSLGMMDISNNLTGKAYKTLSKVQDQIIREQLQDYALNRRFRSNILCRKDASVNRAIAIEQVSKIGYLANAYPSKKTEEIDFTKPLDLKFTFTVNNSKVDCNVRDPIIAAMLYAFHADGFRVKSYEDILLFIKKQGIDCTEQAQHHIKKQLLFLLFKNMIMPWSKDKFYLEEISSKPRVSNLVRYQARSGSKHITSQMSQSFVLDESYRYVIANMDGKNDSPSLVQKLGEQIAKDSLSLMVDGKSVTDEKLKLNLLNNIVSSALQFCKSCGFLIG